MKRMLVLLICISLFCAMFACQALAGEGGSCGRNVTWSYSNGLLTISGSGNMTNYSSVLETIPWHSFRGEIEKVVIGSGVTSIGDHAFDSCSRVNSVTIAGTVTSIGEYAFKACSALDEITIPTSVDSIWFGAFMGSGLSSVVIPYSVELVDTWAFKDCSSLREAVVMNPDCAIGDEDHEEFLGASGSFVIKGWADSTAKTYAQAAHVSFTSMGSPTSACGDNVNYAFDMNTYTLTVSGTGPMESFRNVGYVPWYYFKEYIRSVVIGEGVTTISQYAFQNVLMTGVTIPESMTFIGKNAFYYCIRLTGVVVPENVITVEENAFNGCLNMTSAVFLNPDTSIGPDCFKGCTRLTIKGWYGSTAEAYADTAGIAFSELTPEPTLFLPEGLTTIQEEAFRGIKARAVKIPASVTHITGDPFGDSVVKYIYGVPGTAAEIYALDYGYVFVPAGE